MGFTHQRVRLLVIATTTLFLLTGLAISFFTSGIHYVHASGGGGFNQPGNVLITDQFNNRVVEVDRNKHIVWSFGSNDPTLCNPGPGAIIGTNGAERLADGFTVIAGTGIPPGASSFLPGGCVDNRVIVVDPVSYTHLTLPTIYSV